MRIFYLSLMIISFLCLFLGSASPVYAQQEQAERPPACQIEPQMSITYCEEKPNHLLERVSSDCIRAPLSQDKKQEIAKQIFCQQNPAKQKCDPRTLKGCYYIAEEPCLFNETKGLALDYYECQINAKDTLITGRKTETRGYDCQKLEWEDWRETESSCDFNAFQKQVLAANQKCQPESETRERACEGENRQGRILEERVQFCQDQSFSDWQEVENTCRCAGETHAYKTEACSPENGSLGEKIYQRSKNSSCEWGEWILAYDNCLNDCQNATLLRPISSQFSCEALSQDDICIASFAQENQLSCERGKAHCKMVENNTIMAPGFNCYTEEGTPYQPRLITHYECHAYCGDECQTGEIETRDEVCPRGQVGVKQFQRICGTDQKFGSWKTNEEKSSCRDIGSCTPGQKETQTRGCSVGRGNETRERECDNQGSFGSWSQWSKSACR